MGAVVGAGAGAGAEPLGRPELRASTERHTRSERHAGGGRHSGADLPTSAAGTQQGGPDAADATLETTITELSSEMGYPREVVPSAELVAIVSSGEGTELPHWTDPPTGEVPSAIAGPKSEDDELQAWRLLGSRGLHWRDDVNDWSDGPGVEDLVDEDDQRNGMPEEGTGSPFSFDEDFERLEHERSGRGGGAVENGDESVLPEGASGGQRGQRRDGGAFEQTGQAKWPLGATRRRPAP